MAPQRWPDWCDWELELTPHLLKRMQDRCFNELELRAMLHNATSLRPDVEVGRWAFVARLRGHTWEVIVEPDMDAEVLVVVTAYPTEGE